MTEPAKQELKLPQGVTEQQLTQWKRQHGKVYPINVHYKGNVVRGLFRKPTLAMISASAPMLQTDPVGAMALTYESCKLAADPEFDTVDELKLAAYTAVQRLWESITAEVGEPYGDEA